MSSGTTIAFDVMGGDQGSRPCVSAAEIFAKRYPDTQLMLFGNEKDIVAELSSDISNVHIAHSPDFVSMNDDPTQVLRHKLQSSMHLALKAVSVGRADACVSSGNTGALMALARHSVKMSPGVKRPAICKEIPTQNGSSLLLDLGANIKCTSEHLVQFALMGCALSRARGAIRPKVALLNVGSEITKGTDVIKGAAASLFEREGDFEFVGFIEGDELYSGRVDVIVCDGFVGNVALKVSEGLVKYLIESLDDFFDSSLLGRLSKIVAGPVLKAWSRKKNPSLYNGAAFLGLRKTVIKSHGSADVVGLVCALEAARNQTLSNVLSEINSIGVAS